MIRTAERVKNLRSPIRDKIKVAKELEANGKEIFYFNVGDPNRFDFDTPEYLKRELIEAVKGQAGYYSKSEGDEDLVNAIIEREGRKNSVRLSKEDVVVTQGVNEGILFLSGGVDAGHNGVLLPGPGYPPYMQWMQFFGTGASSYRTSEESDWEPDIDDIRKKITDATQLLVLINPNNPTGAVYSKSVLKQVVDVAGEHNIALVADEIYDEIVFDGDSHIGLASVANDVPVIVLNGFSKRYLVPGWRIGYMYFHDPSGALTGLKEGTKSMARQRQSASTPMQKACAKAFGGSNEHIKDMNKKLAERAEFAFKRLNEINRITSTKPKGAFYIFPKVTLGDRWKNDEEFCDDVLKNAGIVFPHGSGFDAVYGKGHFRSIFLPPVETLEKAFGKLESFMNDKAGIKQFL